MKLTTVQIILLCLLVFFIIILVIAETMSSISFTEPFNNPSGQPIFNDPSGGPPPKPSPQPVSPSNNTCQDPSGCPVLTSSKNNYMQVVQPNIPYNSVKQPLGTVFDLSRNSWVTNYWKGGNTEQCVFNNDPKYKKNPKSYTHLDPVTGRYCH